MTTSALVLAMLPIAAKLGEGSEWRAPMAVTVIGGLLTSTLLTLVVVPAVYTLVDDLQRIVTSLPVQVRGTASPPRQRRRPPIRGAARSRSRPRRTERRATRFAALAPPGVSDSELARGMASELRGRHDQ